MGEAGWGWGLLGLGGDGGEGEIGGFVDGQTGV